MISYISGILTEKQPTYAVVENNGIGFELLVPLSTFDQLPDIGTTVQFHAHLHVREDAINLVGFITREEKELFQLLLTVSGIGMRSALSILSGCKVPEFFAYVAEGNENALTRIPGLGKKTAQRLIIDLKDKAIARLRRTGEILATAPRLDATIEEQTVQAMMSLGYAKSEAIKAIEKAARIVGEKPSLEELLRAALRV